MANSHYFFVGENHHSAGVAEDYKPLSDNDLEDDSHEDGAEISVTVYEAEQTRANHYWGIFSSVPLNSLPGSPSDKLIGRNSQGFYTMFSPVKFKKENSSQEEKRCFMRGNCQIL